MSLDFAVLCLAGFGIVAALSSLIVHLGLPLFDRFASGLRQRHRVGLWLGLALLPLSLGVFAIAASFFPALGLVPDHCLQHGQHHPHLCPHHMGLGGRPGLVLVFVALWVVAQVAYGVFSVLRAVRSSRSTATALLEASQSRGETHVFPGNGPDAFVVGLLRPRVFVSRALASMGAEILEPVLAHERIHVKYRDSLWRALFPMMTVGHFPAVAEALFRRLSSAQELAADEDGARSLSEGRLKLARLKMARALVALAKSQAPPAHALSFTDGDVEARVRALMDPPGRPGAWSARLLIVAALLLPVVTGLAHDVIHHELETLLGSLS